MAGDYIPFDHDFPEKLEVLAIHEATGVSVGDIMVCLHKFWRTIDRQTTDGALPGVGIRSLIVGCGGTQEFWEAVISVGWLKIENGAAIMPLFDERLGKYGSARQRMKWAQQKRRQRRKEASPERTSTGHVHPMSAGQSAPCPQDKGMDLTRARASEPEPEPYKRQIPPNPLNENKEPAKSPRKRTRKAAIPYPPEFVDWWMQYPKHRREGKDKAAEAYPRAVERIVANHPGMDYDQARAYLRQKTIEYAASPAGNNGVFTPLPASWLNAGRFEDEAESWTKGTSANGTNLHDPRGTLATAENYLRMRTEAEDAARS